MARLEFLEKVQKEREEEKRIEELKRAPVVVIKPWSILKDEHILEYYPQGHYQKPEVLDKVKWNVISEWIMSHDANMLCQTSMGVCLEWLYVFHHFSEHSKLYTEVQRDRTSEKWLTDYPELIILHCLDSGKKIVQSMVKMPQIKMTRLGVFQDILKGNQNE